MFKIFATKNNDYETLSKRITDVQQEVLILKQQVQGLEIVNDDLRNKVLRKIQNRNDQIQQEVKKQFKAGQKMRV